MKGGESKVRSSPSRKSGSGGGANATRMDSGNKCGSAASLSGSVASLVDDGEECQGNVRVVVRVRPVNDKERKTTEPPVVQVVSGTQAMVLADNIPKSFTFSAVLGDDISQAEVFDQSGVKTLIDQGIEGFSATIFCYGQTGSGKTHTLTGPPHLFSDKPDVFSEDHGLIYRSFVYLFDRLQQHSDVIFTLKASFYEIYNEKVIDLLNVGASQQKYLNVRWSRKHRGFYVENLFTVQCDELDDLVAVLEEGMRYRAVGFHSMNEHSSRSHTILTVHVIAESKTSQDGVFLSRHGKVNFVDLAGSEMTKKTKSHGKTLEEANNINKSLMVLGYCISQLSEGKKRSSGHIPYRDSQLTKLLADSLAGNGVTVMMACVSPARSNLSETLNTLRYAARAKRIRNNPIIVMDPREALILSLKRDVSALKTENEHLRALMNLDSLKTREPSSSLSLTDSGLSIDDAQQPVLRSLFEENSALRHENAELYAIRDSLIRDHEAVCRENEGLIRKLVTLGFSSSSSMTDGDMDQDKTKTGTDNPLRESFTLSQMNRAVVNLLPASVNREMKLRGLQSPQTLILATESNTRKDLKTGGPLKTKKT